MARVILLGCCDPRLRTLLSFRAQDHARQALHTAQAMFTPLPKLPQTERAQQTMNESPLEISTSCS